MADINYIGTWTLFKKETWRFLKVYNQTLVAPVVTSLLFLLIFQLSIGSHTTKIADVPFEMFIASGLIMMTVIQQAFANSSSSLVMAKVIGFVIDFLMPPLKANELLVAMTFSAVLRGFLVAILAFIAFSFFIDLTVENFGLVVFYLFFSSLFLALLGVLAGIISETFDQVSAITSYIITPFAFLSGTFYSIENLPPFWQIVAHFNPFFFMIDGFRFAMTGHSDGNIEVGMLVICGFCAILWVVCFALINKGYRLKQ